VPLTLFGPTTQPYFYMNEVLSAINSWYMYVQASDSEANCLE
jgi:hypothetical protein